MVILGTRRDKRKSSCRILPRFLRDFFGMMEPRTKKRVLHPPHDDSPPPWRLSRTIGLHSFIKTRWIKTGSNRQGKWDVPDRMKQVSRWLVEKWPCFTMFSSLLLPWWPWIDGGVDEARLYPYSSRCGPVGPSVFLLEFAEWQKIISKVRRHGIRESNSYWFPTLVCPGLPMSVDVCGCLWMSADVCGCLRMSADVCLGLWSGDNRDHVD